ncbi:hypothetical protein BRE01_53730 [Brevibacillus reuszeri]|uniref:Ethanolamine utilization protein n=1 Tax=Brevibacillus reuszeri TaxID=54915 RepID=A0A0K9YLY0_9BACL|nr:hypothetical protein [Brevibacillus reuszeri]KNB69200.1 hypothetical protein ADS79_25090 [Brevibacillus reuszeri]MED1860135.1 hypothetical protein [Brevibacillus reuszeri]GED71671.1 hypothetical protein BRE01_53730 [Brevibacillus reuszeri]
MDMRQMIESITREILQSMKSETQQEKREKWLYIFCDSRAHESFEDQFIALQNNGICHDILFLDGETSSWLGMHRIECGGAGKLITADEYAPIPLEVPKEYAGVILPEMDLDNAARVAAGMKGTIKAEIIFSALVLGKPVLVGEDVPGLKRADRRTLKTLTLPKPYQQLFLRHVNEMKELGVEFYPQKQLADAVIRKSMANRRSERTEAAAGSEGQVAPSAKLLTADWVKAQEEFPDGGLVLRPGTIVSPLAQDMLREKGIAVHYEK